ncbi:hypothetical protein CLOBOL_01691 [Enterocloster bolteae ATCC BAA-613]|uniref:Uncharacterized protein n=1 Tax=Enterocloster bolteae (strain ATCC BAA-613 / DSM 15670 / CCUG 46953 / JCM 12243 / WAL 16351) TaxID=411902 RepID=A8RLP3_ENTBW|nr:hypothetical protein CLOBOL_01691 [Enterocloster bolteae ATCC BAA-613]
MLPETAYACASGSIFISVHAASGGYRGSRRTLAQAHKNHEFGKRGETDGRLV